MQETETILVATLNSGKVKEFQSFLSTTSFRAIGPDKIARFICILALARHGKVLQVFNGVVEGKIAWQPRGAGGFGYDPIFLIPELDKTLAELSIEQKQRISHRGKALQKLGAFLANSEWNFSS